MTTESLCNPHDLPRSEAFQNDYLLRFLSAESESRWLNRALRLPGGACWTMGWWPEGRARLRSCRVLAFCAV